MLLEGLQLAYSAGSRGLLFENLSVSVESGQLLLITGPNGSGKSSLISLLLKRQKPTRGLVRWSVPADSISFIPQLQNMEFHLPLTLGEVIEIQHEDRLEVAEIESFRLLTKEQLGFSWNTSSGGERQRTLLSSALLGEPQILVLDEPFNHLDDASQHLVTASLKRFLIDNKGKPRAIILVSHTATDLLLSLVPNVRHFDLTKAVAMQ